MSDIKEHSSARLLVEGNDDFHVVHNLCSTFSVDVRNRENKRGGQFSIKDCKGITNLLPMIPIELELLDVIGIIIDADNDSNTNWAAVRNVFKKEGYDLPEKLDSNGCICETKGNKIGVWIMPNNNEKGMLENFIAMLIDENDTLLPKAEQIVAEIEKENLQKYKDTYHPKALIYTWLAWQESPGTPMGQAITKKYLNPENKEICDRFVNWINQLFIENRDKPY